MQEKIEKLTLPALAFFAAFFWQLKFGLPWQASIPVSLIAFVLLAAISNGHGANNKST